MIYVDTSALVKMVVVEERSEDLRAFLADTHPLVSSALVRTELVQAAARHSARAALVAKQLIDQSVATITLSDDLLDEAGALRAADAPGLRSLDAIHVASALSLRQQVDVVTYDQRMAAAVEAFGLRAIQP